MNILIMGVGNEILSDDAIGPKLCDEIKNDTGITINKSIDFEKVCVGGMEMLDYIKDYDHVILIDAIKTRNGKPGDVYHYVPDDFKETLHLSSVHDISFLTALDMGNKIGYKIPEKVDIIAVEIVEDLEFSNDFSPEISKNYSNILKNVKKMVLEMLQ